MNKLEDFEVNFFYENRFTHAPLHRADVTSSGMSLRQFPRPTFQGLKDICNHYLIKADGIYGEKVAARFLNNLARDVINFTEPLQEEFDHLNNTCRLAEKIVEEWQTHWQQEKDDFHLQISPAEVKSRYEKMAKENRKLKNENLRLKNEKKALEHELYFKRQQFS
eukprot:TRINITY_DN8186_c0_g1_i1.p1 TRINITY_DN8186_c0_g1~~TRINITY_DN8186_c0_g1_i1.p1  ORF type:complete len:183 (+),score=53.37 TRINITY_DN8186_c0_g1_i1:55-549(+)